MSVMTTMVTDRSEDDVRNGTAKGFLNASDLVRIESAIQEVAELAAMPATVKTDWLVGGLPRSSDWERIIGYVQRIRNYAHLHTTPAPPERPINHFEKLNDVEQILQDAYGMLSQNAKCRAYAGEIYAGEGGLF